jgi:gluconate 2-dehydrogenase alpha chain
MAAYVGGAIMGADPSTSVVNNYLQMWDFNNVFVVRRLGLAAECRQESNRHRGALAYRLADGIIKVPTASRSLV